jgi:rhamnose utilization protein RhaD (predicted bifunctional aldolase and dehydrogenase)/NAD(P)-dependent dehydrogenase (short-subunit alcohol dehydrogenase family)
MNKHLADLIEISRYYGQNKDFVIAGGGNTSYKSTNNIWVKASGTFLANITLEEFAHLDRNLLKEIYTKQYSEDSTTREAEVKADLFKACCEGSTKRPSVETSLHELINYAFVVHTHPTLVNAITCSNKAEETIKTLFGNSAMFIPYCDPGYMLFKKIHEYLLLWRLQHQADPKMIFLQNHGIFVAADSIHEIRDVYASLESVIRNHIKQLPLTGEIEVPDDITKILPALRMIFSKDTLKVARIRNNNLANHFISSTGNFQQVSLPFTPDQIVYCKARPIYLEKTKPDAIIEECKTKVDEYFARFGYLPKIAGIKGYGVVCFEESAQAVDTVLHVFEDWMKISYLTNNFGGPHFLTENDISFIDNWEVENYRRQVARVDIQHKKAEDKIVVVTGGAQGFGEGITKSMLQEGANVVIADLNNELGAELAKNLNKLSQRNEVISVKTNVTEPESLEKLIAITVKHFGGIDVFISNAGILRAGGLDEMTPETFDLMTRVNYSSYFLCAKYASGILKLQAEHKKDYFSDIIQINSKSGIKGSNRNFAYAGGKFGGIGLTQSFALELIPWRIKVNAICPGNFFEGPLWSDPKTGLFVQYLKTGKVPGAKTIADVKAYYEKQVPAGRGCRVEDVMKAIYYVIEQEYETGQAIPVTGGQEMLN